MGAEILLTGAAQLLFLRTPPHAVIDLAVRLAGGQPASRPLGGLVNAVLRKVAGGGSKLLNADEASALNTPAWLMERWTAAFGRDTARAIAASHLAEPPLDLTAREPAAVAAELGGVVLPTGTVRLAARGRVEDLAGYLQGSWWVQDEAAALPARLLGDVRGLRVADLCAAPGGKTAQLAAGGAVVTAVERSAARLKRLETNLQRLNLAAELVCADAAEWQPPEPFDAVLLDALLGHRDDPAQSGRPPHQNAGDDRRAGAAPGPVAGARHRHGEAGRASGLCHLLARGGGMRAADRGAAEGAPRHCAGADQGGRARHRCRAGQR